MDAYKVKITPQASAQLLELFSYISNVLKEPVTAERLLNELQKSILSLATMPKRVPLVDAEPWKSRGIRKLAVKNFMVYFWVYEEQKQVHVIAVIYGKRNQLEQLKESAFFETE